MGLVERVKAETRIGKLKLLAVEANNKLPIDRRISGYSSYNLSRIEELRKLILDKIENAPLLPVINVTPILPPSTSSQIDDIRNIQTITELKKMARMLSIPGYSKYNASQKDILRNLIIKSLTGGSPSSPSVKISSVISSPPSVKRNDLFELTVKELKIIAKQQGVYIPSKYLKADIVAALSDVKSPPTKSPPPKSPPPKSPPPKSPPTDLTVMTVKELKKLAELRQVYIPSKFLKADIIAALSGTSPSNPIKPSPASPTSTSSFMECRVSVPRNSLPATSSEDYYNTRLDEYKLTSQTSCFKNAGIDIGSPYMRGGYGATYLTKYNNNDAVVKVVHLPGQLGYEAFKWECVLSTRAGLLGVGPQILKTFICGKVGVIIMAQCTPLGKKEEIPTRFMPELYRLITKLHDNGIAHRDLGYRNIMKSGNSYVLIDYGLALGFNGPVPHGYRIWDHMYLSFDMAPYYKYLQKTQSKAFMAEVDSLEDDVKLEEMTVKYFPEEMIKTIPYKYANMYLNNATTTKVSAIVDRLLKNRYDKVVGK